MPGKTFLRLVDGVRREIRGVQQSAGAADAGDIPALGDDGRLDQTVMPDGVGPDSASVQASEALAAGDLVDVYTATVGGQPVARARKADASAQGKDADAFTKTAVAPGQNATLYFEGANTGVAGLTPGARYYLSATTPGAVTATPPTGAGVVVQPVGVATAAGTLNVELEDVTVLAS